MSEADKMFEELGYKQTNYMYKISYTKKINDEEIYLIEFVIDSKLIFTEIIDDEFEPYERRAFGIDIKELQAINKKVEELGWNES